MLQGNVVVGQSGGPTSVINSSLVGVFKTAKDCGVKKVYGMRNGIEGLLNEHYIDMEDYIKSDLDIELLKRTPSSFLGSCRYKLPEVEKDEKGRELYCILVTYTKGYKIVGLADPVILTGVEYEKNEAFIRHMCDNDAD